MSKHRPDFTGVPVEADEENVLLRAALADAQQRIRDLERNVEADDLTPLPGARRFRTELERVIGLSGRHGTTAAVVTLELTGLDRLRAEHGHFAADAALVHVARLLCDLIRSTDVLARVGEAEFALILDHLDLDSAIDAAERLARCVQANPVDLGHAHLPVACAAATTGILSGDTADDVLARAKSNLERAKREV